MRGNWILIGLGTLAIAGTANAEAPIRASSPRISAAPTILQPAAPLAASSRTYTSAAPALDGDWTRVIGMFLRDSNPILPTVTPQGQALAELSAPASPLRAQLSSVLNGKVGIDITVGTLRNPAAYPYQAGRNEAGLVLGYKGSSYTVISVRADVFGTGSATRFSICSREMPSGIQACGDLFVLSGFPTLTMRLEVETIGGRSTAYVTYGGNRRPFEIPSRLPGSGGMVGIYGAGAAPAAMPTLRNFRVEFP